MTSSLDFSSAPLLRKFLFEQRASITSITSGSQMLISFAHLIHQTLLLRFTVCGVYGFFLLLFLKLSSLFPFPANTSTQSIFPCYFWLSLGLPIKNAFFPFASFSSPIASAYTHRHVYKRPLCTSGLLSALAFRIALFSVLFDYKSSFIWAAREIWSEFNFPPKASFVVFGHPSSETLTTPYSSMTRFHINQNANHFLVFLITDVHFSPFIFSSFTTRASRRLFLLFFVGIGFTVEDDKSKSLPRSRKAPTAGSAAIFRLVALLIYFLFITDYERKKGKKKLSFFCFPLFSRLFFFSTLLSVFSSPCVCGSRASRAQFHFTERKTMWNWKAPSSFPFCRRRSSQKALRSPHPAFVALACSRRCVCVCAPRIMNERDITMSCSSPQHPIFCWTCSNVRGVSAVAEL